MAFLFKKNRAGSNPLNRPTAYKSAGSLKDSPPRSTQEADLETSSQSSSEMKKALPSNGSSFTVSPWSKLTIRGSSHVLPRYSHSSHLFAEGGQEMYIFGGISSNSEAKNDLWVLNLATSQFSNLRSTGQVPSARLGHASVLVGNAFIVFGGLTNKEDIDHQDNSLYLLNTSSLLWQKASASGARPSGRYGHTLSTLGSKVWLFGGRLLDYYFNDLVCFDLNRLNTQESRWELASVVNDPPPARAGHVALTYSDKLYIFGGTDGQTCFNDVWCFHPKQSAWSKVETFGHSPPPRAGHAASIIDDVVYVFGGRASDGSFLNDLYAFKILTKQWYKLLDLPFAPSPRSSHSLTSTGLTLVLIGGKQMKDITDSNVYMLDVTRFRLNKLLPNSSRQRNASFFNGLTGNNSPPSRIPSLTNTKVTRTAPHAVHSTNNNTSVNLKAPIRRSPSLKNDQSPPDAFSGPAKLNSSSAVDPKSFESKASEDDVSVSNQHSTNKSKLEGEMPVESPSSITPSLHSLDATINHKGSHYGEMGNDLPEKSIRSISLNSETSDRQISERISPKEVSTDDVMSNFSVEQGIKRSQDNNDLGILVEQYSALTKEQIVTWFKQKLYEILNESTVKIETLNEKLKVSNAEKNAALFEAALSRVNPNVNKQDEASKSLYTEKNSMSNVHLMQENVSLHKTLEVMRETSTELSQQMDELGSSKKTLIKKMSDLEKEISEEKKKHHAASLQLLELQSVYRDRESLVRSLEDQLVDQTMLVNNFASEKEYFKERSTGFENTVKDLVQRLEATDMLNISLHESLSNVQTENSQLVAEVALLKSELTKKQAIIDSNSNIYSKLDVDRAAYERNSTMTNNGLTAALDNLLENDSYNRNSQLEGLRQQLRINNAKLEKREKLINASKYIEDGLRLELREASEKINALDCHTISLKEENGNMQVQLMNALEQRNNGAKQLVNLRMQLANTASELDVVKLKLQATIAALEESKDANPEALAILRGDTSQLHELFKQTCSFVDSFALVKRCFAEFESNYQKYVETSQSMEGNDDEGESVRSNETNRAVHMTNISSTLNGVTDAIRSLEEKFSHLFNHATSDSELGQSEEIKKIKEQTNFIKVLLRSQSDELALV
ncbi:cell end marker Tea1 [Schizosaccharomyces cryophilus OY26]|uniref:Cell end marker Tea1 n=1 Tax=Schizosaccharomyces cryophilus (strain OY26 / ATCC MYA-4695 / CBS 11777 / NBRC 106824 / NRRL Y48691) TaxID=653667 RepID=S9XED6_SCHCR|nr:cell end marker Tea1 [Schizosaccharomyces cryophilus OY26]EPY52141.1 cell end marker Tea1 [Schizosaccharomyces cryophilus OY26]